MPLESRRSKGAAHMVETVPISIAVTPSEQNTLTVTSRAIFPELIFAYQLSRLLYLPLRSRPVPPLKLRPCDRPGKAPARYPVAKQWKSPSLRLSSYRWA